ncbi:MAG TPA: VOC family protein, partial [Gammaproteobacteria bacterium]|jgi:catechol 2,3-dioxygenase-like lactoylglutathione lyase family enzyme|nr:VOC family protein [Gammaproteobacteria bacterium]
MQGTLDHIVLNTADVEGLLAFYTGIVGLPAERLAQYRRGEAPFPSLRIGSDSLIDLFPPRLWQRDDTPAVPGTRLNHFCLTVSREDWEALRQRLDSSGVKIHRGPGTAWGAHGDGTSIYFRDPEGNQVEARYY